MGTRINTVRIGVTNIYVLRDRGTVLIDPAGPARSPIAPRKVMELLGAPPQLDLMVVTHAHFDHVGASVSLHQATGAPLAVHREDAEWLREGKVVWPKGVTTWGRVFRTLGGPLMMPFLRVPAIAPDLLVGDEGLDLAAYGIEGQIVHTPGHSPGSLSVVLPSGEAFVGDLAMNGPPMCLHPSFGVFAHEPERVSASWRRLLAMGVRTVYPAHGRPFPASALPA
jgi:glyoxylase-like metal-dependent hydrolase (beta-lactamase superfamily II)